MDLKNQKEIPEYVTKLPPSVQDFVYDGEWEKRTLEIAKKYSLNETQADDLANIVVLVLIGLESPATFLDTIVADLGISRLLAEQIMGDLETRVFEYALGVIEKQQNNIKTQISNDKPNQNIKIPEEKMIHHSPLPEIRPQSLPMVEKNEPVKIIPPISNPVKTSEPVQRPVPVPRFVPQTTTIQTPKTFSPNENVRATDSQNRFSPHDIINSKITPPTVTSPQAQKPPEKYTIDPYREPIE